MNELDHLSDKEREQTSSGNAATEPSPAAMYEEFLVPGIHARWTPHFLRHASVEPGERVLDLACGTGIVTRSLAQAIESDGHLVAVDVSPDMLAVARDLPTPQDAAIEWCQGDAHELPFADGTFDVALCQQGLQFFDDRAKAVREMRRVVQSDGRAVISVWQDLDRHPLYAALSRAEARYLDKPVEALSTPFSMGNAEVLRRLFDEAGFQRVNITQESHEVRFPSPSRFVALTLLAAASIISESELDEEARAEMIETISRDVKPTLQEYVDGESVAFPMHAHIVVAYA